MQQRLTGERRLTLDQFWERFSPPVYLVAVKLGFVIENNPQAQIFAKFTKCSFVKRYLELHDNYQTLDAPLGMIFGWPGLPGGLILHNGERDQDADGVFTCWRSGDNWLVLEPFAVYLRSLHQVWHPEAGDAG